MYNRFLSAYLLCCFYNGYFYNRILQSFQMWSLLYGVTDYHDVRPTAKTSFVFKAEFKCSICYRLYMFAVIVILTDTNSKWITTAKFHQIFIKNLIGQKLILSSVSVSSPPQNCLYDLVKYTNQQSLICPKMAKCIQNKKKYRYLHLLYNWLLSTNWERFYQV